MKIKDLPLNERPRERFLKMGKENVSNEELLSILIKTGTKGRSVKDIALEVLSRVKKVKDLENINVKTFSDIKGLGQVKIIELLASIELGKRIFLESEVNLNTKYTNPEVIFKDNRHLFKNKKQEYFYCLYLDNKNKLIERKLLFMGTLNRSVVHPREIFKEAYLLSASKFVCMHNHPSGDLKPSNEDIEFTKNLIAIGRMQGIPMMDHVIIADDGYYSFYDNMNNLF